MTRQTNRRLIACETAAKMAGVDVQTLRRWFRESLVPGARRIGERWYVDAQNFEAWLGNVAIANHDDE